MKPELKSLLDLHVIDTKLLEAKKTLAALDSGTTLKQGLEQTEKILANRTATLRKYETELQDNELKLKSLESKKKDYEKKLYDGKVTNPKELQGIQQEIEMIGRNREKLDERILQLYDQVEQQRKSVKEAEERREQFRTRLDKVSAQYKSKSEAINAEIASLARKRESAVGTVPADVLKKYENIRTRSGGIGLAVIENDACGACHTKLTTYQQIALREDKEFQFCESCGRFLCLER
jgi:predicted  nucleic acid-binding Zn-ribbon protein